MNPSEKLNAVTATENNVAHSRAAVGIDIVVNDGLGDVSDALLVGNRKDTGDVDAYTDHCTGIERIQPFRESLLVKILKSDFIVFPHR